MTHEIRPSGELIVRKVPLLQRPAVRTVADAIRYGTSGPMRVLSERSRWQKRNRENFERSLDDQDAFARGRLPFIGHLWLAKVGLDGRVTDYGLVSCRVVTDSGVAYIVDAFQNLTELENLKFHGIGTGTTAEAATQTALVTELTTQYSASNTRPTGTTGEQAGNANVYETVATIAVSASVAATEHGIFSQAAVAAASSSNVMLDRSVFAAVNLAAGENLQATYRLTLPSGG